LFLNFPGFSSGGTTAIPYLSVSGTPGGGGGAALLLLGAPGPGRPGVPLGVRAKVLLPHASGQEQVEHESDERREQDD
jgi:hypothetical protein